MRVRTVLPKIKKTTLKEKQEFANLVGNSNGNYSNKHNRAQKLMNNWAAITTKMERIIVRGGCRTIISQRAYIILLMMETGIRIGNGDSAEGYVSINKFSDYYNKEVQTYGATTLLIKHTKKMGDTLSLKFLGKKQVANNVSTTNKILVSYYSAMKSGRKANDSLSPDSNWHLYNKFVKRYIGRRFTAKDLRTAKVNIMFIEETLNIDKSVVKIRKSDANRVLKEVLIRTAKRAGHTPTVCKSKYVSPDLIFDYKLTLLNNF